MLDAIPPVGQQRQSARESALRKAGRGFGTRGESRSGGETGWRTSAAALFGNGAQSAASGGRPRSCDLAPLEPADLRGDQASCGRLSRVFYNGLWNATFPSPC